MALVHEETKHEYLGAQIMVSQRERREVIEDWAICHLEVESMDRRTPDELVRRSWTQVPRDWNLRLCASAALRPAGHFPRSTGAVSRR
jgi:hypothetical protein